MKILDFIRKFFRKVSKRETLLDKIDSNEEELQDYSDLFKIEYYTLYKNRELDIAKKVKQLRYPESSNCNPTIYDLEEYNLGLFVVELTYAYNAEESDETNIIKSNSVLNQLNKFLSTYYNNKGIYDIYEFKSGIKEENSYINNIITIIADRRTLIKLDSFLKDPFIKMNDNLKNTLHSLFMHILNDISNSAGECEIDISENSVLGVSKVPITLPFESDKYSLITFYIRGITINGESNEASNFIHILEENKIPFRLVSVFRNKDEIIGIFSITFENVKKYFTILTKYIKDFTVLKHIKKIYYTGYSSKDIYYEASTDNENLSNANYEVDEYGLPITDEDDEVEGTLHYTKRSIVDEDSRYDEPKMDYNAIDEIIE